MAIASETTALDVERLDGSSRAREPRRTPSADRRPGDRRPHRLGAGGRRARACGRARPDGDGGDRIRRLRGQGGQELHRHRVPLRLPQGQAVRRRDRRGPRARDPLRRGAGRRRARADADHQPDVDRAVQGDRRGQDAQRRHLPPSARVAGSACAPSRSSRRPARRRDAAGTLQVIPDPTLDVSQYLFHHPGVDFIWTTGGPKAVAAANAAGKPCLSVGAGNAPVYIHRSADVPMAVDMLISKTFDSSLICPPSRRASSTTPSGTRRWPSSSGWARGCSPRGGVRARGGLLRRRRASRAGLARPVVRGPRRPRRVLGGRRRQGARAAARPTSTPWRPPARAREADAGARPRPLAVGRACAARRGDRARERRDGAHLRVYATDETVIDAFATAVRTGRILVNAPTAVGVPSAASTTR